MEEFCDEGTSIKRCGGQKARDSKNEKSGCLNLFGLVLQLCLLFVKSFPKSRHMAMVRRTNSNRALGTLDK
jgi:hypothetical protein